jgi:DNA-binding transcriptional ArsR family regulator
LAKKVSDYQTQSEIYKVLMHPTRLAILDVLRTGEQCVCHMEAVLGLRQAHISQHLMVLREAGLVSDRRDGWNIFYRVCRPEIYQVIDAMEDLTTSVSPDHGRIKPPIMVKKTCPCPKCSHNSSPIDDEKSDGVRHATIPF